MEYKAHTSVLTGVTTAFLKKMGNPVEMVHRPAWWAVWQSAGSVLGTGVGGFDCLGHHDRCPHCQHSEDCISTVLRKFFEST